MSVISYRFKIGRLLCVHLDVRRIDQSTSRPMRTVANGAYLSSIHLAGHSHLVV